MKARLDRLAGGRALVWAGRTVLWAVVAVVGLTGIKALVVPPTAAEVPEEGPEATFPAHRALALAAQVAVEYLTWGTSDAGERGARLHDLFGASVSPVASATTEQQVLHVVPAALDVRSESHAVATVAAHVMRTAGDGAEPVWLHVEVPLRVTDTGAVSPDGLPAFVGADAFAPGDALEPPPVGDPAVAAALTEPLHAFFRAYAAGDAAELDYLTTGDVTVEGLAGAVELDAVERTAVLDREGDERTAVAAVRWRAGDAVLHQWYRLEISSDGDRWYVARVSAYASTAGDQPLRAQSAPAAEPAGQGATGPPAATQPAGEAPPLDPGRASDPN